MKYIFYYSDCFKDIKFNYVVNTIHYLFGMINEYSFYQETASCSLKTE